jgi:2-oxoglutarate ferredoxin oxidoreductase subunit beta
MESCDIMQIHHPVDTYLHDDASPSVWCSGCGIGTVFYAFLKAVEETGSDPERMCIVSGFGCTGHVSEYIRLRSYDVEDGTVFGFGAKLSDENPNLKVVVFSNNTDFLMTGGQDFMEIRKRRPNLLVVHINNFFYIVTEKGLIPNTPFTRSLISDFADIP